MSYEYAVVPAPKKGLKARGVKSSEDRFANALQSIMNEYGAKGWEYVRTDTLPSEERSGLTGRTTVFQNMMVFRKSRDVATPNAERPTPAVQPTPESAPDIIVPAPAPLPDDGAQGRAEPQVKAD